MEARQCKQSKYQDLVDEATEAGFCTELITLEIVSRGMIFESELSAIQAVFVTSRHEINHLAVQLIRSALLGSYKIRCSRNQTLNNSFHCTISFTYNLYLFGTIVWWL